MKNAQTDKTASAQPDNVSLQTVNKLEKRMGKRVWDGVLYNQDGITNPTLTILHNEIGREIREILTQTATASQKSPHIEPYGSGFAIVWPDSDYPGGENWEGGYVSVEAAEKSMRQQSPEHETTGLPWTVETRSDTKYPDITLAQVIAPQGYTDSEGKTYRTAITGWLDSPADARLIVRSVNNAEALAEELRNVLKYGSAGNENHIREALAAYEKATL